MKPTAALVNCARGQLVDAVALADAVRSGAIAGAGLDVFPEEPLEPDHELLALPGVVATAHVAGVSREASARRAEVVAENLRRVAAGRPPLHLLDAGASRARS
jgi:phosphoglycerate dehydrogenase-like enzyme